MRARPVKPVRGKGGKAHKPNKPKPDAKKRGPKGNPPSKVARSGDAKWGAKVAKKRQALGLTQREMAERFDILQPHMCNLEKGTYEPSAKLRARIDKALFAKVNTASPLA